MYALSLHTTTSKALSAEPTRINSRKMARPLELVAGSGNLNMLRSLLEEHNYDPKLKGTVEVLYFIVHVLVVTLTW